MFYSWNECDIILYIITVCIIHHICISLCTHRDNINIILLYDQGCILHHTHLILYIHTHTHTNSNKDTERAHHTQFARRNIYHVNNPSPLCYHIARLEMKYFQQYKCVFGRLQHPQVTHLNHFLHILLSVSRDFYPLHSRQNIALATDTNEKVQRLTKVL